MIKIYTDGSCSNNQSDKNFGGWGCVLIYKEHIKKFYGFEINTSNNRMELMAVIKAFSVLKRFDIPIKIFSDSAYIVNCINNRWYVNWQKNTWKNAKKEPVLNRDLWETILYYYNKCKDIEFIKIKGHINPKNEIQVKNSYKKQLKDFNKQISIDQYKKHIEYNNLADELAVKGSTKAKENLEAGESKNDSFIG